MDFDSTNELIETTLYSNQAEKDAILKDPSAVAEIVAFNFFGMLGLINATNDVQRRRLTNFFKTDKRMMLSNINDDNHDISLSIKLANDAGFFKSPSDANKITLFLAKLKSGTLTSIDSQIIAKFASYFNQNFYNNLKDINVKTAMRNFLNDKGETIDVSSLAITFKKRVNKNRHGGQFALYAKQFPGLSVKAITPTDGTTTAPVAAVASTAVVKRRGRPPKNAVAQPAHNQAYTDLIASLVSKDGKNATLNLLVSNIINASAANCQTLFTKLQQEVSIPSKELVDLLMSHNFGTTKDINSSLLLIQLSGIIKEFRGITIDFGSPSSFDTITPENNKRIKAIFEKITSVGYFLLNAQSDSIFDMLIQNKYPFLYNVPDVGVNLGRFPHANERLVTNGLKKYISQLGMANIPATTITSFARYYDYNDVSKLLVEIIDVVPLNVFITICETIDPKFCMKRFMQEFGPDRNIDNILDTKLYKNYKDIFKDAPLRKVFNMGKRFGFDYSSKIDPKTQDVNMLKYGWSNDSKIEWNKDQLKIADHSISSSLNDMVRNYYLSNNPDRKERVDEYIIDLCKQDDKRIDLLLLNQLDGKNLNPALDALPSASLSKILSVEQYKQITDKYGKDRYISQLINLCFDDLSPNIENIVADAIEDYPQNIKQKIKERIIEPNFIIEAFKSSPIQFFSNMTPQTLNNILKINGLSIASVASLNIGRKPKNVKFLDYAKTVVKNALQNVNIPEPKVKLDPTADIKKLNKMLVDQYHAGKHGDIYPQINKVYHYTGSVDEYNKTRVLFQSRNLTKPGDSDIVPAFHGTGGIAASMILRFGFKVIPENSSLSTGRMLGSGIYFTSKIDKALQYVSNSGYGRTHGTKGYLLSLNVNLGQQNVNYVGGNTATVSPEWCVRDPLTQIKIITIYEVTLVSKKDLMTFLKEDEDVSLKNFGQFIKEDFVPTQNTITYSFQDNKIPTPNGRNISVDDAIRQGIISRSQLDYVQGIPTISFSTKEFSQSYNYSYVTDLKNHDLMKFLSLMKTQRTK